MIVAAALITTKPHTGVRRLGSSWRLDLHATELHSINNNLTGAIFSQCFFRDDCRRNKDVCKKFEQEGVTTRNQSGGNAGDVPANVVVVVGAGSSHSRRRNTSVANSDIIVGANMTEISTQTDLADDKPATAKDAANTCE